MFSFIKKLFTDPTAAWPRSVTDPVLGELRRPVKHLAPFAGEIRQLVIEDVCLFWPTRPDDGMIYFKGPNAFRVWRCDYIGRTPVALGFDG
jgi:hypothetical protein